jgi:hypothetical protein
MIHGPGAPLIDLKGRIGLGQRKCSRRNGLQRGGRWAVARRDWKKSIQLIEEVAKK